MNWQKKARLGIAIFGVAIAVGVFFAVGEREKPIVVPVPVRLDPRSKVESTGAVLQQVRGTKQDFQIKADRQLTYEGGATKFVGIRIMLPERRGRDFIISAREAQAGDDRKRLDLNGDVKLASSDGFEASTADATFTEADGYVRAPGPVSFRKGRMSGSGVGMSYNEEHDMLTIGQQSHVKLTGEDGATVMEFTAGSATLARSENYLLLEGSVHALRSEQVLDADKATARLTDNDEQITYIELRGNSRVAGGSGTFDAMTARDIDLDYTDDGKVLERLVLNGVGAISLLDQSGAPGRQMRGDLLDLTIAPDGTLTRAVGSDNVRLDLPAASGVPARSVRARTLDGVGEAGKGLTGARFADEVEYREEPQKGARRVARARALRVALVQDAISEAVFSGAVKFEEESLRASAAEARYQPDKGTLRLLGTDAGGGPRVADENVTIEAESIDVILDGPKMSARGKVKTIMQPGRKGGTKLPGLFQQEQAATATSASLEYDGEANRAVYTGNAALWQGQTALRAETILLDRQKGDMLASGAARSTITIDNALSVGRAEEIRYDDATRVIAYRDLRTDTDTATQPAPPIAPGAAPVAPPTISQLSGPQGDLRANRIIVTLAKTDSQVERLDASGNVTLRLDQRLVTGSHMTYFARDERYVMSGAPAMPVKIVDECRETIGRTLTFFKSTDRIIVDGNEEIRTQTKSGGPCQPRSE